VLWKIEEDEGFKIGGSIPSSSYTRGSKDPCSSSELLAIKSSRSSLRLFFFFFLSTPRLTGRRRFFEFSSGLYTSD